MSVRRQATLQSAAGILLAPAGFVVDAEDSVMTSIFRADGTIFLQNRAAKDGFVAPEDQNATPPFLRHFVSPSEALALLARMAEDETIRAELPVHTKSGIQRQRFIATPLGSSAAGERLFLFVEAPFAPSLPRSEEQQLRDYAEAAADWFWETDGNLQFAFMSESTQTPAASAVHMFTGKRLIDFAPTEESGDPQMLVDLTNARLPFRDVRLLCGDARGEARQLSFSGLPIFDSDGAFRGYRGIARDLTLLVRAEKHAAIAQNRLMDAIESIPECFLLLDAEDRLVLCNSRYREVNAAIAPWLVAGTPLTTIYQESVKRNTVRPASGRLEDRFKTPIPEVGECCVGDRWYQISERRTHDGGSVVVQTEITALKRREHELAEKTEMLRATLDNMRQGIFVVDRGLRLKLWNDKFCELFGLARDKFRVGLPFTSFMCALATTGLYGSGDPAEIAARRIAEIRKAPNAIEELNLTDGRVVEVRRSAMPDGGFVATYLDVSDRKQVEANLRNAKEEAELASRTKTEFLANISHELRTPLNAIIGFSEILGGEIFGPLGDKRYVNYATDIHDSGQHLLTLINDVLDVSKIEVGKLELNEETVNIAAVVESCMRLMRGRAEEARLDLRAELPRTLPFVQADARRLKQILLNLLSNAVKFTPAGGHIRIEAALEEEGLRVSVSDTGIGIAPEDLEKALRPFGQIDSRLARKYEGTGLGLPLTKSMIELHGGRLTLESAAGRGTTAAIWLPAARIIDMSAGDIVA